MIILLVSFLLSMADEVGAHPPCVSVDHSTAVYNHQNEFIGCRLEKIVTNSMFDKLGMKVGNVVHTQNSKTTGDRKMVLKSKVTTKKMNTENATGSEVQKK